LPLSTTPYMNLESIKPIWEELELKRKSLFEIYDKLSDEKLNQKPADNGWSMMQVLHHLLLIEELGQKYMSKKLAHPETLNKPSFSTSIKKLGLKLILLSPLRVKAPEVVSQLPEFASWADTKMRYENNRNSLYKFMQEIPQDLADKALFKHPVSGWLNIHQTLEFLLDHWKHHEYQINRLRSSTK
jgi:hypothetical protein